MDVFSTTSKQVAQQSTPTVDTAKVQTRAVEQSHESAKTQKDQMLDKEEIKKSLDNTVKNLNKQMEELDTNVKFGFNDKIDTLFVDVMERSTGKIIRKIPSEEAMKLSERMKEIVGMIFDKKG